MTVGRFNDLFIAMFIDYRNIVDVIRNKRKYGGYFSEFKCASDGIVTVNKVADLDVFDVLCYVLDENAIFVEYFPDDDLCACGEASAPL